MNKLKEIPKFTSEKEEREFWQVQDSAEYVDWGKAKDIASFPNLKPSSRMVSIHLPDSLVRDLKTVANKKDVPYQSLVKIYLHQKVKEEMR